MLISASIDKQLDDWKAQQSSKLEADKKQMADKFAKELQDVQKQNTASLEQQKKNAANAEVIL